jgi:beta-glucosidase-like glycosyl hydrolase/CubicO group peptidase (beta-lactamase class C family)
MNFKNLKRSRLFFLISSQLKTMKFGFLSLSGAFIVGMLLQWVFVAQESATNPSYVNPAPEILAQTPKFLSVSDTWADSIMKRMTREQKIAQFFMVAAYSDQRNNEKEIQTWIEKYGIGGVIFFQGDTASQKAMTQRLQAKSNVPLLVGMDAEWGPAMRLSNSRKFPFQLTMAAAYDEKLTKELAYWIGRECADLGVHLNFAPVADINTNPKNPIIGFRAFGENPRSVANQTVAFVEGMEHAGVMACVKHFPGHGDTDKDSHHDLPLVRATLKQFEAVNFLPFVRSIQAGVSSVMVAHLEVPALDSLSKASSLSSVVIKDILQGNLKFEGLVISDALNMKAVANQYQKSEVVVRAFLAGNDILLFPESIGEAIEAISKEVQAGKISEKELNARCKKVLKAKYWAILNQKKSKLISADESLQIDILIRKTVAQATTILKNENQVLPLRDLSAPTALVVIGENTHAVEQRLLDYIDAPVFKLNSKSEMEQLTTKLKPYSRVITVFAAKHNWRSKSFGMPDFWRDYASIMSKDKEQIALFLANPYALVGDALISKFDGFVMAYENSIYTQEIAPQVLVGALPAQGKLPFTLNNIARESGFQYDANGRLQFVMPEEIGVYAEDLKRIDEIAMKGINERAYPGCQVIAAKDGKVFYRKNFGHLDYSKKQPVNDETLYDLASITKIASSTLSLMKLADEGALDVTKKLVDYLPERVTGTSHQNLVLKNILTHQAGFTPWIPFWKKTMNGTEWREDIYARQSKDGYTKIVADGLYIKNDYRDSMFATMFAHSLSPGQGYKYSDLGYYFMQEIIENYSARTLDEFVRRTYYAPMGLAMRYNPLEAFSKDNIAPTEDDNLFRKQLIHGHVHDQGAAMVGGVAGHAGLFSNATDLAALMQMLLNGGEYGGMTYLSKSVIDEFTKCQFCATNRRALGFDKPVKGGGGPSCDLVSPQSYGHTGFTGTIAWADPVTGINYVFLSNRVHPDAENKKIITMGTRTEIQKVIYLAFNRKKTFKSVF